ncbi:MAG: hypothetical protein ACFB0B_09855 [Thermonemataceae bacterium]
MKILNSIITFLKEEDLSLIQTVRIIKSKLNISLNEAQKIVLRSEAWADSTDTLSKLNDEFLNS